MMDRGELEAKTRSWISLWSVPADWTLFEALHATGFVDESSAGRGPGRESFRRGVEDLLRAFPDLRTVVEDLVVDVARGRVAVRWSAAGTNREAYLGVGPTGRGTRITGIEIVEIREGKIVRRWGEWDITDHLGPPAGSA